MEESLTITVALGDLFNKTLRIDLWIAVVSVVIAVVIAVKATQSSGGKKNREGTGEKIKGAEDKDVPKKMEDKHEETLPSLSNSEDAGEIAPLTAPNKGAGRQSVDRGDEPAYLPVLSRSNSFFSGSCIAGINGSIEVTQEDGRQSVECNGNINFSPGDGRPRVECNGKIKYSRGDGRQSVEGNGSINFSTEDGRQSVGCSGKFNFSTDCTEGDGRQRFIGRDEDFFPRAISGSSPLPMDPFTGKFKIVL